MKQSLKRIFSWLLVVCMVLSFVPAAGASGVTWKQTDQKITAQLSDRLVQKDGAAERAAEELVRVSIVLEAPSTVEAGFATMGIDIGAQGAASSHTELFLNRSLSLRRRVLYRRDSFSTPYVASSQRST